MPGDPRVKELVEELLESGRTPEEVCSRFPELLTQVRERWRRQQACDARLEALFPTPDESPTSLTAPPVGPAPELPRVPGYEVEAVIGHGGMGVVFRARHLGLNRVVALKMMIAGAYAGRIERERFQREAEAVAALRHPNVVHIYDIGTADNRPYFTMEFMDGASLANTLTGAPWPAPRAAAILATLAKAVEVAHRGGIVHRDLKPANVLLAADGTPKISDFGLARRLGGEAGLTHTGLILGTPGYMAPEQAEGKRDAAGPATDIYALGVILYELLTGRPPFRAETDAATIQQVISREPVFPSRLNSTVPRDLETVCLKCLQKDARRRYAAASTLAADLDCFLRGEPIAARPYGPVARLAQRVRRRPLVAGTLALCALLMFALIGTAAWTISERTAARREADAVERAATADLAEMEESLRRGAWPEARAARGRAKARLGTNVSAELSDRIDQGERELTLADRLDAIRLTRAVGTESVPDWKRSIAEYEAVFHNAGLLKPHDDPDTAAARIRALNVQAVVVDALDDWAFCVFRSDPRLLLWLRGVADRADPDPAGWRNRARAAKSLPPTEAAVKEAETGALASGRCDPLVLEVARDIARFNKDPILFLIQIQQAHPGDLFANLTLAEELSRRSRSPEAVRFYQAALAIRPEAPGVWFRLGIVLSMTGQHREAVDVLQQAVKFGPESAEFRVGLVRGLIAAGRNVEAMDQARQALREIPKTARAFGSVGKGEFLEVNGAARVHAAFAAALTAAGKDADALVEYQRAAKLEPALTEAFEPLRQGLMRQGRLEELQVAWRAALAGRRVWFEEYYGYAELSVFVGREDDYRTARQALLKTVAEVGSSDKTAAQLGRACLLLPATGDELLQAVSLADRVAALDRKQAGANYPFYQFAGGLADYRRGRFDRTITSMRGEAFGALGPAQRILLAMALHESGQTDQARKTLTAAIEGHDWTIDPQRGQEGWICQILRREAERLTLPHTSAIPSGK